MEWLIPLPNILFGPSAPCPSCINGWSRTMPVGWCKLGNWAASTHWWPSVLQTRQLRNPWLLFRLMSQCIMGWGTPSPRLAWNRSGVFIGDFWALCMIGSLDWNGLRPARMVCGPTFPGLNFFGVTLRIPRGFRPFGSKVSGLCWTKIQLLPLCCRRWWRFFALGDGRLALCASVCLKRSGHLFNVQGLFRFLVPVLCALGLWAVLSFRLASFLTLRISLPHLDVCSR